jgi:phosphoglycerate dehydrogenase-like enzyme
VSGTGVEESGAVGTTKGSHPLRIVVVSGQPGGVPGREGPAMAQEITAALGPAVDLELVGPEWEIPAGVEIDGLVCGVRLRHLADLPDEVRWVQVWGTGVDGLPPQVFGATRTVTCARGAGAVPISEFVLATMLAFEKDIPRVWVNAPPDRWYARDLGGLHDRTLAVLGLGAIGSAVARLGLAFGMSVKGLRSTPGPSPVPGVSMVGDALELADGAHHLVVTAPATPATRHIVGEAVLARLAPGAHLVNIARGSLVDQDALRDALDRGQVGRASLDVTDPEPLPAGHWLYEHPGVRVSPHVSWSSHDGHDTIRGRCVANVVARAQGRPFAGVVDPGAGY